MLQLQDGVFGVIILNIFSSQLHIYVEITQNWELCEGEGSQVPQLYYIPKLLVGDPD